MEFTQDLAERFTRIALGHVQREFPNKLDHVLNEAGDARSPRELHPIFYGSFDWHSCVHGHWMLACLRRLFPNAATVADVDLLFAQAFTAENVAGELAYLSRPLSAGFERPYGWAWFLMLAMELRLAGSRIVEPLEEAFVERFHTYLPKLTYPVRAGTHANTAFAVALASDYAQTVGNDGLRQLLAERAQAWFGNDRSAPAWEPSGDDFLSPTLMEAECMRRVLPVAEFGPWFAAFLPDLIRGEPAVLLKPATVSDRSDGKIAHLDGLNLSRAWCMRMLEPAVDDGRGKVLREAAEVHLAAALPHLAGNYMGEHWLASFAVLALSSGV